MDSGKAVENSKHDRHEWRKQREYPGFNSGSAWKKDQGRRDHGRGSHKASGPDQDLEPVLNYVTVDEEGALKRAGRSTETRLKTEP